MTEKLSKIYFKMIILFDLGRNKTIQAQELTFLLGLTGRIFYITV